MWHQTTVFGVMLALVGCGMGSVHSGEKARVSELGVGCKSEADARKLEAYFQAKESTEHINSELMYPLRCIKIYGNEILTVTAEDGDFRRVRRDDGMELWLGWQYLHFVAFN
jgi:hypothetical protein